MNNKEKDNDQIFGDHNISETATLSLGLFYNGRNGKMLMLHTPVIT